MNRRFSNILVGGENYHTSDHNGCSFGGIFDHEDTKRKVGMGELVAVLNGIEFRTAINRYELKKPVYNNSGFHETEYVVFPDVPDAVINRTDLKEQIDEMREWFKAFKGQDHNPRDYRRYFKPVLTYIEGAWLTGNGKDGMLDKVRNLIM